MKGGKTGGDRQLREGTEEGGKGREGRRSGREWEKNGSRNLAGASKGTTHTTPWPHFIIDVGLVQRGYSIPSPVLLKCCVASVVA